MAKQRSLKHEYELYVEHELETYKDSVPRSALLALGDEAVAALGAQAQTTLTEMVLWEEVDRLIASESSCLRTRRGAGGGCAGSPTSAGRSDGASRQTARWRGRSARPWASTSCSPTAARAWRTRRCSRRRSAVTSRR
jgi:hypothetical protein